MLIFGGVQVETPLGKHHLWETPPGFSGKQRYQLFGIMFFFSLGGFALGNFHGVHPRSLTASLPLKSYRAPKGSRLVSQPSRLSGVNSLLNFGGVFLRSSFVESFFLGYFLSAQ